MPKGDRKHFGAGSQGKRSGSGAMTDLQRDLAGENSVLSNRDKSRHTDQRGQEVDRDRAVARP